MMDVLLKSLKVDSDLPSAAQAQAADISSRLDEITKRLRPDLVEELFQGIEKGALSQVLSTTLVPEIASLLDSGLQELLREEARYSAITQRVDEAYRRVVEVQMPMAEFLSQKNQQQDSELVQRVEELKRYREALAAQKSALERLGEKISSTKQRLIKLKEQAARLGQRAQQPAQSPPQSQPQTAPQQS